MTIGVLLAAPFLVFIRKPGSDRRPLPQLRVPLRRVGLSLALAVAATADRT